MNTRATEAAVFTAGGDKMRTSKVVVRVGCPMKQVGDDKIELTVPIVEGNMFDSEYLKQLDALLGPDDARAALAKAETVLFEAQVRSQFKLV